MPSTTDIVSLLFNVTRLTAVVSQLYRRKCLIETKLAELSTLEAAEETDVVASGLELQDQNDLRLRLTDSNLTNPDPKNENSRIGSIINAIDRGVELDQDAIEAFTDALR